MMLEEALDSGSVCYGFDDETDELVLYFEDQTDRNAVLMVI